MIFLKNLSFFLIFFIVFINGKAQTWKTFNRATTSTQLSNDNVTSAAKDIDGSFWFGTDYGVSHYNGILWKNYTLVDGLSHNKVLCIAIDKKGVKWFGTQNGLCRFDGKTWTKYLESKSDSWDSPISSIAIEPGGIKWIGTPGSGVYRYDDITWTNYKSELRDTYINSIAIDSLGVKWFGTRYGNMSKFDNLSWSNYAIEEDKISDLIKKIFIEKGNIKLIMGSKGAYRYDDMQFSQVYDVGLIFGIDDKGFKWANGSAGAYSYVQAYPELPFDDPEQSPYLPHLQASCVLQDSTGKRWFGTNEGVWTSGSRSSPISSKQYTNTSPLLSDYVEVIGVDSKRRTWLQASYDNLFRFDDSKWATVDSSITDRGFILQDGILFDDKDQLNLIGHSDLSYWQSNYASDNTCYAKDAKGNIWLGDNKGNLLKYDGDTTLLYENPYATPGRPVYCLAVDLKGDVWVGGETVIARFDGVSWHTEPFYPQNIYTNIAVDPQGDKWISPSVGLSKYDDKTKIEFQLPNDIGIRDIKVDAAGTKWFATSNGAYKFDGVTWTHFTTENGLAGNRLSQVYIDDFGDKWFFAAWDGLSRLSDGGPGPFKIYSQLKRGMVFHDRNGNGKKDNGEINLAEQIIQVENKYISTKADGVFTKQFPKGEYTFNYHPKKSWKMTTDSSVKVLISESGPNDTLYFGTKPSYEEHYVATQLTGSATRANFKSRYWLTIHNQGSFTENGSIVCVLDPRIKVEETEPVADSIIGSRIVWKFSSLLPFAGKQVQFITKMPGVEYLRDTLISLSYVNIASNRSIILRDTLKQVLTGSYDPNIKQVKQGIGINGNVLPGTILDYTIHFQNSGTDTAFNVVIKDSINFHLDLQSIEITGSSHPVSLDVRGQNIAAFIFENILLPDSGRNELGSIGFVTYRIKPKSNLAEGTLVTNKAFIYFDFNPPIVTNETKNTYHTPGSPLATGILENLDSHFVSFYPNPSKDEATLVFPASSQYTVLISDLEGKELVKMESVQNDRVFLDFKELSSGMYLYRVENREGLRLMGKFVISK